MSDGPAGAATPEGGAGQFRWQALFQRSDDPLFILNRRRAILFVNQAWEKLTGLPAGEARQLVCRRRRPVSLADPLPEILAQVLCPPPEALQGETVRVRRLLPGAGTPRWWDVEFTPLREQGRLLALLGRIVPVPLPAAETGTTSSQPSPQPPLPLRLAALRQQVQRRLQVFFPGEDLPTQRRLADQVRLAAQVRAPVVLLGPPGSGKQTLARLIHAHGPERERSFAALDCTRLPAWSVAALLLADAGAAQRRQLGTIYLHEPGYLPREHQMLLWERLLQSTDAAREDRESLEGLPEPLPRLLVGFSMVPLPPWAQIVSGQLLQELFCALDTIRLELPALQDRMAELPQMIERSLVRLNSDGEKRVSGLTPEALELLAGYPWPGNLAEMLQVLDQARLRATGEQITPEELPLSVRLRQRFQETPRQAPDRLLKLDEVLNQVERRLIVLALQRARGHKARACELLGIWRPRLLRRMKELEIDELFSSDGRGAQEPEED